MNIREVKDLPYLAVITPQGHIIGQWKGIENLNNAHEALKSVGYSPIKTVPKATTTGADFIKKTEPIYQNKMGQDELEFKLIRGHFDDSNLSKEFKLVGGETRIRKVAKDKNAEPWLSNDMSRSRDKCGNFYIMEVVTLYDINKHLYCTSNNEAFLISSHSGQVDKILSFISNLYKSNEQVLTKKDILSKCEDRTYCSYMEMLFTLMPDESYNERHLLEAINGAIKKWDEMNASAAVSRQQAHDLRAQGSVAQLSGKSDQLLLNYKEKKICIPYSAPNAPQTSKKKYLILSYRQEDDLKSLDYNLSNDRHIQTKHIIADAQEWMKSSEKVGGLFSFYIFFDVSKEYIIYERDEKEYYSKLLQEVHSNVQFDGVLEYEQAKKQNWYYSWKNQVLSSDSEKLIKDVIKRKWLEEYGHELYAGLHVVASFDQQDQISVPTANSESKRPTQVYNPSGFLVELKPPINGVKYVKAKFFIRGIKTKRDGRILTASKLDTNQLFYISMPQLWLIKAEEEGSGNCLSNAWKPILPNGTAFETY